MTPSAPRRFVHWLPVLAGLLPIALAWVHKEIVRPRPFWSYYYDPEMIYFHGGRHLLHGRLPENLDNPGILAHVVAALAIAMVGDSPQAISSFFAVVHVLVFVLGAASLAFAVKFIFQDCDWKLQAAGIWVYYLCAQSFEYLDVLSPESLFPACGAVLAACVWRCREQDSPLAILLSGAAAGLCCSVKFTFAPLALALVVAAAVTSPSARAGARAGVAAALGVAAGFLAGMLPVVAGLPRAFSLVVRVATHDGQYGSGPAAMPDLVEAWHRAASALLTAKSWYLWLALVGALIVAGWVRSRRAGVSMSRGTRFVLAFAVIGIVSSHLVLLRPAGLRYLLPGAFCAILLLATAARMRPLKESAPLQWSVFVVTAVILVRHFAADAMTQEARMAEERSAQVAIAEAVASVAGTDAVVVYAFRAPSASMALRNDTEDEDYQLRIDEMYPSQGHVASSGKIRLPIGARKWDALVVPAHELKSLPPMPYEIARRTGDYVVLRPARR